MTKDDKKILKERAFQLSRPRQLSGDHKEETMVVKFLLHPEVYAIEAKYVQEVLSLHAITPIPGTPPHIMGVINHRGKIVSIVNMKGLFGLQEKGLSEMNKVLLIRAGRIEFGLIADAILGSAGMDPKSITAPPATLSNAGNQQIPGIFPDGSILIDAEKMAENKNMIINQS